MAKKFVHKDGVSKAVDFSEVIAHYEKGWTDAVERTDPMTEAEIALFQAKVTINNTPCPTCGHVKEGVGEAQEPLVDEVGPLVDDEPVEEDEEPVSEATLSYAEYTRAELLEMIKAEGESPNQNAKKEDLIKTLIFIREE